MRLFSANLSVRLSATAGAMLLAAAACAADPTESIHAAASEHGEPAGVMPTLVQGIMPMIVTILVFITVLVILGWKVWPKIEGGLRDREEKIRSEIAGAELARNQAKDALEQYNKSLANARAEAQKMIDTTKAAQSALAAELRAKADVELSALRDRAMRDIDAARKAAISEIYTETAALASSVAAKILKREINSTDQRRLVEESLGEMQSLRNKSDLAPTETNTNVKYRCQ